jgi:hypothetical protein
MYSGSMDPRILLIVGIIGFRIFRTVQAHNKKKTASNPMKDLSNRSLKSTAKPAGNKHKRNRDDPFDGMHGDVSKSKLTIDDIVT